MNAWEKRDAVESTLSTGDALRAQTMLDSIKDQQLFMDLLASKAQRDNLPGLVITADKQEHVHQIKTPKMTITDEGGHLTAKANSWTDALSSKLTQAKDGVIDFLTTKTPPAKGSFEDCWNTKLTSDSCTNRRIDSAVKANGG